MIDIKENVSLAPLTTLQIGGPARFFLDAETEADVFRGLEFAKNKGVEPFIIGGGSNLLIADDGIDSLVIRIAIKGVYTTEASGRCIITAAAGENWDGFVYSCVENGLAGIECLSGIPGLVGGTPVQNVGAYGQEVSETIRSVRCIDRLSGEIVELTDQECGFSYRTSIFNSTGNGRYIVLAVRYSLNPGGTPKIVYRDLLERFAGQEPTLKEVREAVLTIRRSKSMVIDPADPNSRSAGSFFKNPVIDATTLEELTSKFGSIPSFAFGDKKKVPAAWLIENAGFNKGFIQGSVGLSTKHTLGVINRGGATSAEIIDLTKKIQNAVYAKFGISLVPEPVFAGF